MLLFHTVSQSLVYPFANRLILYYLHLFSCVAVCTARAWLLMAGFSLAFGAMFSKTWRVHSIFTDVKLNKKVIKDYQLFMVVGILLAIDIVIMLTWQFADPFYRDTKQIEPIVCLSYYLLLQRRRYKNLL